MELEITHKVLLSGFLLAMVLGAVVRKTGFCTMGAISDWVNMGHKGRLHAWFFAIAVAVVGVLVLELGGSADLSTTLPPYRSALFMWPRYLLGGLMFGVGMTLASGCGNQTAVRIGGGNTKSILVFLVMGLWAYLMTKTDFYGYVFHSWMLPLSVDLARAGIDSQALNSVLAGLVGVTSSPLLQGVVAAVVALGFLVPVLRSRHFRERFDFFLSGAVVGAVVVAAWYLTGGAMGVEWKEFAQFMDQPPAGVDPQSLTFVNPTGEALYYLSRPGETGLITFGVVVYVGVVAGSLLYSLVMRRFHFEWFRSLGDFVNHVVGGTLMGIGGVLAMGCTIGQGVTGVSTLALGSLLALGSIILGSALTMKVAYYRLVYENEAGFWAALVSSLVDLRLLPKGMRRLEVV